MSKTKKISIDYSIESVDLLDSAKSDYYRAYDKKASNSFIANYLVENTFGCPFELKREIVKSLNSLLEHYNLKSLTTKPDESFLKDDLDRKKECIESLILIFGRFNPDSILETNRMRRIKMAENKTIRIPADWIVVNEEEAEKFSEAVILECLNSRLYGIPHFLIFCDETAFDCWSFTKKFENHFYAKIIEVFPDFQLVLDAQVDTKTVNGEIQNLDEWGRAPIIGLFRIKNSLDIKKIRENDKNYNPPMGVYIDIPE